MKLRLALIFVILSMIITVPALATEKTLRPGFSFSNDSASVVASPTDTPVPTIVPTDSPAGLTASTTPSAEASPTPALEVVVIDGKVTLPDGVTLPAGTNATLLVFNSATQQVEQTIPATIQADGSYEFSQVTAVSTSVFLVTVDYGGVTYDSNAIAFDGTTLQLNLPVTVHATTKDLSLLNITQAHMIFDFSTAGKMQVEVVYVISVSGQSSVMVTSNGSTIPFIQTPANAQSVNFQLDQNSSPLMQATGGFAFLPGADKTYAIDTIFSLPYTGRQVIAQPFSLPVASVTAYVPEGVIVSSKQLNDAGTKTTTGTITTYHIYQGSSLASGSTLNLTIVGMPGDKPGLVLPGGFVIPGLVLDAHAWEVIGAGAVGLILIALGIFLFLRDRRLRKLEDEELEHETDDEPTEPDAIGDNRDSILDAILSLDDEYKVGNISKEIYKDRRDELKNRLKKLP